MSNYLLSQKDFKELKAKVPQVNELVEPFDKGYMVSLPVLVDKGLVTKFCKAYTDATTKDLRQTRGELSIAEMIVQWVHDNLAELNLPAVEIVTGVPAQGQVQMTQMQAQPVQAQPTVQPAAQPSAQDGTTPQVQAQSGTPAPPPAQGGAQAAATDVPAQEI